MLKQIISGDQTPAGRAAMDFALEVGIPSTSNFRTQKDHSFTSSQGTLIISHGKLTGRALSAKKLADQKNHPYLEIDLATTTRLAAAGKIVSWIVQFGIERLRIIGQKAEEDTKIYEETLRLLRGSYYMATLNEEMKGRREVLSFLPVTIEQALESLTAGMSLKEKIRIARMDEGELTFFSPALAAYVRDEFGLCTGNRPLIIACRTATGGEDLDEYGASFVIIRKLWEGLRATHSLRLLTKSQD